MSKQQIIGTLKQLVITSKVDDNGRQIHVVTTKIELIDNKGRESMNKIAETLNKPIRVEFEAVQLDLLPNEK